MKTGANDFDCWAYTETTTPTDEKGHPQGATVIRFDPSKPYAEQLTPLKIQGKPPTDRQLQDYRKRGEKRGERLEREANAKQAPDDDSASIEINGQGADLDFAHATLTTETATSLIYLIPLRSRATHSLPVDRLQLTVQVGKERHVLEHGVIRLLAPMRLLLVAKIKQGELSMDWTTIDPAYAPVTTAERVSGSGSVLFFKFNGGQDTERTDYKRVKPYSARFGVKIGPLKTLPF